MENFYLCLSNTYFYFSQRVWGVLIIPLVLSLPHALQIKHPGQSSFLWPLVAQWDSDLGPWQRETIFQLDSKLGEYKPGALKNHHTHWQFLRMKIKQRNLELRYGREKDGVLITWIEYLPAIPETRTIPGLFQWEHYKPPLFVEVDLSWVFGICSWEAWVTHCCNYWE